MFGDRRQHSVRRGHGDIPSSTTLKHPLFKALRCPRYESSITAACRIAAACDGQRRLITTDTLDGLASFGRRPTVRSRMPCYREAKGVSQQACVVVSKKVVALME
jgi:hypothetical protein